MKRIVGLIVVFVMTFSIVSFAGVEDLNISEMTTAEIIELRNALTEELNTRIYSNNDYIYSGEYVVGKDIAPGEYVFTLVERAPFGGLYAYESADAEDTYFDIFLSEGDLPYHITLLDGAIFTVSNATGIITPYNPSWAMSDE